MIAVDDDAGVGGVARPADAASVIGPPRPDVVEDHVRAVDDEARRRLAGLGATDAEEHVAERRGVGRFVVAVRAPAADLKQNRRVDRAGLEDDARDHDPLRAGGRHHCIPVRRDERREAETEHHRVRPCDVDAAVKMVDARRQKEIAAGVKRRVDRRRRVGRLRDVELADRDRRAERRAVRPRRPRRAPLHGRHEDVLVPRAVRIEVRRLPRHRARRERRVRVVPAGRPCGEALCRRTADAREDLVPDAVRPAVKRAVPNKPLLL